MADLITWSGNGSISFFSKSNEIRGVKDFSIKTSVETEDKTQSSEKFAGKKNSGSYQITMTAVLNAALGVDVQALATMMTEAARRGDTGYFYTAGAKLFPSNFMATDATVSKIQMSGTGKWSYCEVAMTLKQCSKYDGISSSTGGGSGGNGASKTSATGTAKKETLNKKYKKEPLVTAMSTSKAIKIGVIQAVNTTNAAKQASKAATSAAPKKTGISGLKPSKIVNLFKR